MRSLAHVHPAVDTFECREGLTLCRGRMEYPFDQAGRGWRARSARAGERDPSFRSISSGCDRVRHLRDDLVTGYRGRTVEDVFCGREAACPSGRCYVLESRSPVMGLDDRDPNRAAAAILADLTLVPGIGEATGRRLQRQGYRTVADLMRHPLYRRGAARLLDSVAGRDTRGLVEWIGRRHRRSDPLLLEASRFHAPETLVFLDIETLGLSSRPIVLIGLARVESDAIAIRQYLLRSLNEEAAALATALPDLEAEGAALVTFNGRAFDLPFIRERLACYGIRADLAAPHFDALLFARRRWKGPVPACRLSTLETEVLGVEREDDLPGRMVPEFYNLYRRTGNPGPLVPVVEHNRQDLISLVRLFALLRGDGGR